MSKKHYKLLTLFLFSFILISAFVPDVYAQFQIKQPPNTGYTVTPATTAANGATLLQTLVGNVIGLIFTISAIAVLIYVLWGAFDWITSEGNKEKLSAAQKKISSALIGLVVLALSFFVINVVGSIVGFNPLGTLPLPSLLGGSAGQTTVTRQVTPPAPKK